MAEQSNVLVFPAARIKCPVGARVLHSNYGWCDVVACLGSVRTVQVASYTTVDCANASSSDPECLYVEVMEVFHVDVDAGELVDGRDTAALTEIADMLRALGACKS